MIDPTSLDDHAFAVWAAERAGSVLLDVRAGAAADGLEGKALKDAGDAAAQAELDRLLTAHRPDDAVLSEEAADDKSRLTADRVWIIDPLDGTREFSEPPRDDWAVHVALWADGDLVAGAVAQPALGETFSTGRPSVVPPRTSERPRIAVSRSRPPAFVEALAAELDAELVPMGSAGVKVMSVVRDLADAYVHAGGQYQWDNAAPVAVARAAGLHCSRVDGSPLVYNEDDTSLQPTSPASSSAFATENDSAPVSIATTTVRVAPMPTHTAYDVPTGSVRMAWPSPPMLSTSATTKVAVGAGRVRPSERPRAVAHTASRTPDSTSTNHDMTISSTAVLSLSWYGSLVRWPSSRGGPTVSRRRTPGNSGRNRLAGGRTGLPAWAHDLLRLAHDRRLP
jgi:3'(2'), 5'-bisphosphate nucleotidase